MLSLFLIWLCSYFLLFHSSTQSVVISFLPVSCPFLFYIFEYRIQCVCGGLYSQMIMKILSSIWSMVLQFLCGMAATGERVFISWKRSGSPLCFKRPRAGGGSQDFKFTSPLFWQHSDVQFPWWLVCIGAGRSCLYFFDSPGSLILLSCFCLPSPYSPWRLVLLPNHPLLLSTTVFPNSEYTVRPFPLASAVHYQFPFSLLSWFWKMFSFWEGF